MNGPVCNGFIKESEITAYMLMRSAFMNVMEAFPEMEDESPSPLAYRQFPDYPVMPGISDKFKHLYE